MRPWLGYILEIVDRFGVLMSRWPEKIAEVVANVLETHYDSTEMCRSVWLRASWKWEAVGRASSICGGGVGTVRHLGYKLFKCVWRETGGA